LIYKNLGGKKDANSLLPLLSISELSNYYAYLDNWIFDNKNNCNEDIKNIKWIIIASAIFRELCQECIEESDLSSDKKREISKKLLEASSKSYTGQFQDIELTIDKLKEFKSEKDFIDYYQNKSKLASGYFYGLSFEIGAIILGKNKLKDKINSFGIKFGTALHMSNDLGDFGLFSKEDSSFKPYQDQLADLTNKRLTLPIYFVLKFGDKSEVKSLMNVIKNPKNKVSKIKASKTIVLSGSFEKTLNFVRDYEKNLRKEIKLILPKNEYREMIESRLSAITTNKYLKDLKNIKKELKVPSSF
jgi:geranylgeranyl pyrophosphate synthase